MNWCDALQSLGAVVSQVHRELTSEELTTVAIQHVEELTGVPGQWFCELVMHLCNTCPSGLPASYLPTSLAGKLQKRDA